jgi:hypothetical protein
MESGRGGPRITEPPEGAQIDTDLELRGRVARDPKKGWSPEQIAGRLCYEHHRGETGMSVSHETIYTWICAQPKGELARAGIVLRTGREQCKRRGRKKTAGAKIVGMRPVEDRPAEVTGHQMPGHREGDLLIGKAGKSAMGHAGRAGQPIPAPGRAAARPRRRLGERRAVRRGSGAAPTPAQVADCDQGTEMARHAALTLAADPPVYFTPTLIPVGGRHQREHQRAHPGIPPERTGIPTTPISLLLTSNRKPTGSDNMFLDILDKPIAVHAKHPGSGYPRRISGHVDSAFIRYFGAPMTRQARAAALHER